MSQRPTIYTAPSAFPNPQRLRLFMHEKGVAAEFDEQLLDMAPGGEQRSWRHYRRNPFGEAPVLELADGTTLSETPAIVHYIDHSYTGRKITGENPLAQARDIMWDQRCYLHVLLPIVTMFHVQHTGLGFKLEPTYNPAWGESSRKKAIAHAGIVDTHLADGRDWLAGGDEPTFADITLCTAVAFGKFGPNETPLDERFEHIDAHWQRWKSRDAFKKAYGDGGSGLDELSHLDP
ncbi:glutathione S-transferase family protein [Salinisphaera sp. T31B1]|uniref:glutathione S-transferase family protein n=1 Tax=Salinisphaera sp. T31B1 TaxID=727963 RepID=UPI00333FE7FB